jgi:hypothetical protein
MTTDQPFNDWEADLLLTRKTVKLEKLREIKPV